MSWQLSFLGWLIDCAEPPVRRGIYKRLQQGRELPDRVAERFGIASAHRPDGKLLWLHGASLGECNSLMPIVERWLALDPSHHALLTSGSKSSTQQMTAKLPNRAIHQLLPAENGKWIRAFLAYWQPDALVLAEQEFWPRLLTEVARAGVPSLVVNARLSRKSATRWQRLAAIGLNVPKLVGEVHCQDAAEAERYKSLGVADVQVTGNLKFANVGKPDRLTSRDVPTVFFAMSHPEEEDQLVAVLKDWDFDQAKILVGPRHVERADGLQTLLVGNAIVPGRWSKGQATSNVTILDQYGVMPQAYAASDICILGGTFTPRVGGHSPIESLAAGVPVIVGPHTFSQESIVAALPKLPKVSSVQSAFQLAFELLQDPAKQAEILIDFDGAKSAGDVALDQAMEWIVGATT